MTDVADKPAKPTHYKVVCFSPYTSCLDEMDRMVAELKARGFTKMSRSQLVRLAISKLDLDAVELPKTA